MAKLIKEDKRKLKRFELNDKSDFIIYLHELITRTYKCIRLEKIYLERLSNYIDARIKENPNIDIKEIKVKEEVYHEFLHLLSSMDSYILNLIGDHQEVSMSYKKFRDLISKKKRKGKLDFEIRDLDESTANYINEFNKLRNWINHVPESLLMSEIKLIQEGELRGHTVNPIIININNYYTLEYLQDLYITTKKFHEIAIKIHQSMKKDYSSLIGESMRIELNFRDIPTVVKETSIAKLSAQIQGLEV